jgi:hypothetical protein
MSDLNLASLLRLLTCPLCNQILKAPTTLQCAHTLCSAHLLSSSSSCPLPSCPPSSPSATTGNSALGVAYFPPPLVSHPTLSLNPRVDVTINKICSLLLRAQQWPDAPRTSGDSDSDPDPFRPYSPLPSRPRKRRRRSSASKSPDFVDPPDLLQHLRDQTRIQRQAPPDVPLVDFDSPIPNPSINPLARLEKEILSELTCEICFALFHQPVTTPCQHVRRLFF